MAHQISHSYSVVITNGSDKMSSNIQRKIADWKRAISGVIAHESHTLTMQLAPGEETSVFSGQRPLTVDGTTVFSLRDMGGSIYRLQWVSGQSPGFRAPRAIPVGTITIALNPNQTVSVTHSGGAVFGSLVVGDEVFIPGVSTGETGLFAPMNEGYWSVLGASSTVLTLGRRAGLVFSGQSEVVTTTTPGQFYAYAGNVGVQINDTLALLGKNYGILGVSSMFLDFCSTMPLVVQQITPGATGIATYSSAKRFVFLETDRPIVLLFDSSTDESVRVEPIVPGDPQQVGFFQKWGTTYAMRVKNKSDSLAEVTVITAE